MTHGDGAVSNEAKHDILDIRGVVSVGESLDANGDPLVIVRVDGGAVPDIDAIPEFLEGIPVEIRDSGPVSFAASIAATEAAARPGRFRPVVGGTSTSPLATNRRTAGTICAVFTDGSDDYIVSNNHVWAGRQTEDIVQPANLDGGGADDVVATFEGTGSKTSFGDADYSIAKLSEPAEGRVAGVGRLSGWRSPKVGDTAIKSGRTTGVTSGEVLETNTSVNNGSNVLDGQVILSTRVEGGDSGSPVVVGGDLLGGIVWGRFSDGRSVASPAGAVVALSKGIANAELKTGRCTYKGEKRSDWVYTGNERDAYERWASCTYSTDKFQSVTPRGEGTAKLVHPDDWPDGVPTVESAGLSYDAGTLTATADMAGDITETRHVFYETVGSETTVLEDTGFRAGPRVDFSIDTDGTADAYSVDIAVRNDQGQDDMQSASVNLSDDGDGGDGGGNGGRDPGGSPGEDGVPLALIAGLGLVALGWIRTRK